MQEDFLVKKISQNIVEKELSSIGFDKDYLQVAKNKYEHNLFKIFNLTPLQATILKQTALSCGTDCAVHREVLTHNIDFSDVILSATKSQLKEIIKKLYVQPFGLKILAKSLENIQNKSMKNNLFDWNKTYLMGILNCTPNSFSDGGEFFDKENALKRFEQIIADGADIIDIGAESTAPNNVPIDVEEELSRLSLIFEQCRKSNYNIPISIDTRNSKTASKMLELGANIINDVSGFMYDEKMANVVAKADAYAVLTFDDVIKDDAIDDTIIGLLKRVKNATIAGVKEERIILDVGLGFNKTFEQNIELIKRANEVVSLGFPVLYGLSRKSFVQKLTNLSAKETAEANISLGSYLAIQGVNILRVHDVLEHKIAFSALDKVLYD